MCSHHLRACTYIRLPRRVLNWVIKFPSLYATDLTQQQYLPCELTLHQSSEKQKKGGGLTHQLSDVSRLASAGWHTDISFEAVPSDYAMLKIHTLPPTGGDTLWASGYEVYNRLSPAMQTFLEGLTATHDARFFLDEAERLGNPLRKGIRGHPLNQGDSLTAVHPVIRTNRKSQFYSNSEASQ